MADDPKPTTDPALADAVRALTAKLESGDKTGIDASLTRLIERQQERIASLGAEVEGLRTKLPAEDAVVLTADEAATLEAYRKLGKPDEITKQLEAGETAAATLAEKDAAESWGQAATAHGYKSSVLLPLAKQAGLAVVELKTVQPEGEEDPREVAMVREGEDGTPTRLDEYAKEHWDDFLPALTAEDDGAGDRKPAVAGAGSGAPYPKQRQKGGRAKGLTLDEKKKRKIEAGAMAHF